MAWYECVYRASMNYVPGAVSWVVHVGRRLVESIRGYTAVNSANIPHEVNEVPDRLNACPSASLRCPPHRTLTALMRRQ